MEEVLSLDIKTRPKTSSTPPSLLTPIRVSYTHTLTSQLPHTYPSQSFIFASFFKNGVFCLKNLNTII